MKQIAILFLAASTLTFAGATEGKAVYTSKCQTCHGADGVAKESMAKMMKVEMKPLGSKDVQAKSDADLKKVITQGQGKMKPVAGLSDQQVSDIVAYMRTFK